MPAEERDQEEHADVRTRIRTALDRIGTGSALLGPVLVQHIVAWCRRAYRADLKDRPLAASAGIVLRASAVVGGSVWAWDIVQTHRWILAPLTAGWIGVSWRAAKTGIKSPTQAADAAPADASAGTPTEAPIPALVRAQIGEGKAVHLKVLYPAMRAALDGLSEAPDEVLRAALKEAGIPVRKKVRAAGVGGLSGVHREDLPPLPSPDGPSEVVPTPVPTHGDAGQSAGREQAGTTAGTTAGTRIRIVQDKQNPSRHHVVHASG